MHVGREALRDRHYFRIKNSALRITSPDWLTREGSLGRCVVSCLGVNVNINTHNPHVARLRAACIDDDIDDPMQTETRCRVLLGNTGRLYLRSTSLSVALYRSSRGGLALAIEEPLPYVLRLARHGQRPLYPLPGSGKLLPVRRTFFVAAQDRLPRNSPSQVEFRVVLRKPRNDFPNLYVYCMHAHVCVKCYFIT